ncbi:50S ribosomal protein L10 [Chloroflexota bacterium]
MSREKKAEIIDSLEETFSRSTSAIFTDYRGLTTSEVTALRRKLQETGGEYRIVKNTLARFAAERAGMEDLDSAFEGPVAIAFGYNEVTEPAKIVANYIRDARIELGIKGGFLGNRLLTAEEVITLSTLPSREVLLARVLGQMNSPITALVNCLASPIRGLIGVLQAQIKQVEGE